MGLTVTWQLNDLPRRVVLLGLLALCIGGCRTKSADPDPPRTEGDGGDGDSGM